MKTFMAKPKGASKFIHELSNGKYRILVHLNAKQKWKCTIIPKECDVFGMYYINYHLQRNNIELCFNKEEFDCYFEKIDK